MSPAPEHSRRDALGEQSTGNQNNKKGGFLPIPWLFALVLVCVSALGSGAMTAYFHERARMDAMDLTILARIERDHDQTEEHFRQDRAEFATIAATTASLRTEMDAVKTAVQLCRTEIGQLEQRMVRQESRMPR